VGLLADVGGPAQQAMVADLLPDSQRTQGYGILRVVANLAVTIGPMIGGLIAAQPVMVGPLLAGLIMDNANPRWVWYAAGMVGLIAAAMFAALNRWAGRREPVTAKAGI
jgi:MFS family permease